MIKVPSKFLETYGAKGSIREFYINPNNINGLDVYKQINNRYDKELKRLLEDEFETYYNCNIKLANGFDINLKILNEVEFQECLLWLNKNIALGKIGED